MTPQPTVLLVGCGHWSNPGLDYQAIDYDDMRSPQRQREIASCIDLLAHIQPTRVALEITQAMEDAWNADYHAYRDGLFPLTANERHQLGFRLAASAGLNRIHAIDWHNTDQAIGWDNAIAFAQTHGQESRISSWFQAEEITDTVPLANRGVLDQLLAHNDPAGLAPSHRTYIDMALIGEDDSYIGAEVILRWYERNMRMFVNIARLLESPHERIAVIVGSGHLPLLKHFLESTTTIHVENATTYLAPLARKLPSSQG